MERAKISGCCVTVSYIRQHQVIPTFPQPLFCIIMFGGRVCRVPAQNGGPGSSSYGWQI